MTKLGLKFRTYQDWLAAGAQIPIALEDVTMTKLRLTRVVSSALTGLLAVAAAAAGDIVRSCAASLPDAGGSGQRARRRRQIREPRRDILKVLGSRAVEIMFSGDEVADREARQRFIGAYDAKHM